jgi:hypothetical protein
MKKLFDEKECFTLAAIELAKIAREQGILAAFQWVEENGYSSREAAHVIHGEVTEQELGLIIERRWKN